MLRLRRTGYDKLGGYIKTPVDGMVIFQRQNQTQSSMPRSNTPLRHFQNAQDELLAHNWTRAMTYDNREPMVQQASHGAGGAAPTPAF